MKKTALFKDFYREILRNKGRFISIYLIVTLGVAFFSGIRAAEPDMQLTGDRYFDDLNMYDGYAAGTLGMTEGDVEALQALPLIEEVYAEHSVDVLSTFGDRERVLRIAGFSDSMNLLTVEAGRLPERPGEIVLDATLKPDEASFRSGDSSGLGSTLQFHSGTEDDLGEILADQEYTVVGYVSAPKYFSFGRGTTTIGSGDVYAFAYVRDEEFLTDYYSYVYYRAVGSRELNCFDGDYAALMEEVQKQVESIESARCTARYEETYGKGRQELDDAIAELADAKTELQDGEQELADARREVADGKEQLQDAQQLLNSSRKEAYRQFADSYAQLQNVQETIQNGRRQLEEGRRQVEALKEQLQQQETMLQNGQQEAEQARAALGQLEGALPQLNAPKAQVDSGIAQLSAGMQDPNLSEEERAGMQAQLETLQGQQSALAQQIAAMEQQAATIRAGLAEAEAGLAQLEAGNAMLAGAISEAEQQLQASEAELAGGEAQLADGFDTYYAKRAEAEAQMNSAQQEIDSNRTKLADAEKEIADNEEKVRDGKAEIADAEQEIADAEIELADISYPEWYIMERLDDTDYSGFNDNAERMGKIGKVFPVIFFLLAALISLTTMTRMVEEERIQIGTLKALGYSQGDIAGKFIAYAGLATVLGSITGIFLGEKTLPYIIVHAYTIMYPYLRTFLLPLNWYYGLLASGAAVVSVLAATIYSSFRTLQEVPAELMLPPSPQSGKRILLERIGILWRSLNFSWKATVRNLSRYKKRLWMTVVGIGGCMALLMAGFGLRDSIMEVVTLQYEEIQQYDADVYLKSDPTEEETAEVEETLNRLVGQDAYMRSAMKKSDVHSDSKSMNIYLLVPEQVDRMPQFVEFRGRLNHVSYSMSDEGVLLTEKTASLLGVEEGDTLTVELTDACTAEVTILGVVENYMSHYVYMTPTLYESLTGEKPTYNDYMVDTGEATEEENNAIGEKILKCDAVMNISYLISLRERLDTMLTTLDEVIIVLIISAGLLAFVVLYNLNNINITERRREMATLKVLGFRDMEVAMYVYRENIILTGLGIAAGIVMGRLLHMFLITTVEVDQVMFGRHMFAASYFYSIVITIAFAFFVNWIMYYKLKKIDMVESLKSVE